MRVKAKRREGESAAQFLRRFSTRTQKSGLINEAKKNRTRTKKLNERERWERRLYGLKIQSFIEEKLKEGWNFDKALQQARRYVHYLKYKG